MAEARATIARQQEDIERLKANQPTTHQPYDLRGLVALIARHFNVEEIDDLAFQIGATIDDIRGDSRRTRARELALYAERMLILGDLTDLCAKLRPNVEWPQLTNGE